MGDYLVTGYPHVAGYPTTVYPHDRPPSWETNPQQATLRRLPCNGLPLWETAVWQTTHMGDNPAWTTLVGDSRVTDYPHGRQPYDRLPSLKAILQQTALMTDYPCGRLSCDRLPTWETTLWQATLMEGYPHLMEGYPTTDCHHDRLPLLETTLWQTAIMKDNTETGWLYDGLLPPQATFVEGNPTTDYMTTCYTHGRQR